MLVGLTCSSAPACCVVSSSVFILQTGQVVDAGRITTRCRSKAMISILLFIVVSRERLWVIGEFV